MGVHFSATLTVRTKIAIVPAQTLIGVTKQTAPECKSGCIKLPGRCQLFALLLADIPGGQRHRYTVLIGTDRFITQHAGAGLYGSTVAAFTGNDRTLTASRPNTFIIFLSLYSSPAAFACFSHPNGMTPGRNIYSRFSSKCALINSEAACASPFLICARISLCFVAVSMKYWRSLAGNDSLVFSK